MAKWDEVGQELVKKLGSVKKESTIQKLAVAVVEQIRESYEEPNSRRAPLSKVRKAVLEAFPDTETQEHPWQYFTNKGKGNIERYQHLALKYLTRISHKLQMQRCRGAGSLVGEFNVPCFFPSAPLLPCTRF